MEELFLVDGKICKLKDFEKNIAYTGYYPIRVQGNFGSEDVYGYTSKTKPKLILHRTINAWGIDRTIIYAKQSNYYQIQNDELYICRGTNRTEAVITEYTEQLFVRTIKRLMRFDAIYEEEIKILKLFLSEATILTEEL